MYVSSNQKKRPSARRKGTKKSGLTQVIGQIKSVVIEKCRLWHIGLDDMQLDGESLTLYGHTVGRSAVCPCCGKRTTAVHRYSLRKIQCTEWLGHHTTLVLESRHMVCTNPRCERKIFAEPLVMTRPYGRHTHEVEERIRHEALCQTARKASETLSMQHIWISASACIRALRQIGRVNPEVRTSGFVGLDDFAKWKGHKYMCVIVDHYTREVLAVFDSRYGQEIIDWLRSHPEIKAVTRDGSQSYASLISAASSLIVQISDRFHLMQSLKKDAVEPIRALLGQKRMKQSYPYPSEDEAYRYIKDAILGMGDARHRDKVGAYYDVRRLKDEGKSIAETARLLGINSQKVYKVLGTDMSKVLSTDQKQAVKVAREMARIISGGCITCASVAKRLRGKVESRIVHRCMRPITERYKVLREEVRLHNKARHEKGKTVRVKAATIWKYIVTGETTSKELLKLHQMHPEVEQVIQICIRFRKMLHGEDDAPQMEDWLKDAAVCPVKEIRGFAEYVCNDRCAVDMACKTKFSNGLLEGTVNKAKAIKRSMYNRAKPEVLRAKMIYAGMKWDWNYHLN